MPRKPRLDVPGLIYHIIGRGIERKEIFADDADRHEFLRRLGVVVKDTATPLYAFTLIPNHFHLLVRRGPFPISKVMRRLLTGYAVYFNKRHTRSGYLFQNRYKATICQEDPYFLELVRYIHLNPIKAGVVVNIDQLKDYPFSGHAFILGNRHIDWFDADTTLSYFSSTEKHARNGYLRFLESGIGQASDLAGGGLRRSLGQDIEKQVPLQAFDDRVLGEGLFVEQLMAHQSASIKERPGTSISEVVSEISSAYQLSKAQLLGKSKERKVASGRAQMAYRLSIDAGMSGTDIARMLSTSRSAVSKMIAKVEKAEKINV